MPKVNVTEHSGLAKSIKQVSNARNAKNIELCYAFQTIIIDAYPKCAGFFLFKQYRGSILQDTKSYPPPLKQLFHLLLNLKLLSPI